MLVQTMNNHELELNLKKLVTQERELLHEILLHIQQVEVRRIYLDRAYASIYEYLVKELNYSGSAAMRRIEAARLLKQIPSLSTQIESGDLNLSQIGELSKAFKEKEKQSGVKLSLSEKKEILVKVSGKSVAETQKEVAKALDLNLAEPEKAKFQKDESVLLSITFTKEQYEKLNRCRDKSIHKLSQEHKGYSWAEVIENLMDQFIAEEKKSVKKTKETLSLKKASEEKICDEERASENILNKEPINQLPFEEEAIKPVLPKKGLCENGPSKKASYKESSIAAAVLSCVNKSLDSNVDKTSIWKISKTLTPKAKKLILKRDGCCQYVDKKSGRQCESTFGLEVDHIIPQFAGGKHSFDNLQALCKKHNTHRYHQQAQIRFL